MEIIYKWCGLCSNACTSELLKCPLSTFLRTHFRYHREDIGRLLKVVDKLWQLIELDGRL